MGGAAELSDGYSSHVGLNPAEAGLQQLYTGFNLFFTFGEILTSLRNIDRQGKINICFWKMTLEQMFQYEEGILHENMSEEISTPRKPGLTTGLSKSKEPCALDSCKHGSRDD